MKSLITMLGLLLAGAATTVAQSFSSPLPIILISTNGQSIGDTKIPGTMQVIYYPGQMSNSTDAPTNYDGNIGISVHGASSAGYPQQSFSIETRDITGSDSNATLLDMPAESDWVILNTWNDKSFLRNKLAFDMARGMGDYASRSQLCEVVINGQYNGVYTFGEKIKRGADRVDVAKLKTTDNAGDSLTGGYIFKSDYLDGSDSWQSNYSPIDHPGWDVHFVYYYPKIDDITTEQQQYLPRFVDTLETALYSGNFTDTANGFRKYVDVPSFVDYLIVNEVSRNGDGFKKSCYYHKDKSSKNEKLMAGPVWDFDWAWKNIDECSIYAATDGSGYSYMVNDCFPDVNSPGWMVRMMQDTNFVNSVQCRYSSLRSTVLDTTAMFHYVDSMATVLTAPAARHFAVYQTLGWNNGTPEIDTPPTTFQGEIDKLKAWIGARITWLDANLPGHCTPVSTGIANLAVGAIRIYPNPAQDAITVQLPGGVDKAVLSITDAAGRVVLQCAIGHNCRVDLNNLMTGIYICCVTFNEGAEKEFTKLYIDK